MSRTWMSGMTELRGADSARRGWRPTSARTPAQHPGLVSKALTDRMMLRQIGSQAAAQQQSICWETSLRYYARLCRQQSGKAHTSVTPPMARGASTKNSANSSHSAFSRSTSPSGPSSCAVPSLHSRCDAQLTRDICATLFVIEKSHWPSSCDQADSIAHDDNADIAACSL